MQSEEEKLREINSRQSSDDSPGTAPKSLYGGMEERLKVRVTAMRGRGFGIRKRSMLKKDDVPDVYLKIRLAPFSYRKGDKQPRPWKTPTIKDDTMPQWMESMDFDGVDSTRDTLIVEAWDENRGSADEHLGTAEFSVEKLLRNRQLEVELRDGSSPGKTYVTLMCIRLGKAEDGAKALNDGVNVVGDDKDVLVHYHPQMNDQGYEATLLGQNTASAAAAVAAADDDGDDDDEGDVVAPLPPATSPSFCIANIDMVKDDDSQSLCSAPSIKSMGTSRSKKTKKMMKGFGRRITGRKKKEKDR